MKTRLRSVLMPLAAALGLTAALSVPAPAAANDPATTRCLNRCANQYSYCILITCAQDACAHVCDYNYDQCTRGCFQWA